MLAMKSDKGHLVDLAPLTGAISVVRNPHCEQGGQPAGVQAAGLVQGAGEAQGVPGAEVPGAEVQKAEGQEAEAVAETREQLRQRCAVGGCFHWKHPDWVY